MTELFDMSRVTMVDNIARARCLHFVGIKGVAMAGLAVIFKQLGKIVAGSDVTESFGTDPMLKKFKVKIFPGFSPKNLDWKPDVAVAGASWTTEHPELAEAKRRKIPIIAESELRGWLSRQKKTIAVTGVHGKSTTTALIAWVLRQAGAQPSWLVGASAVAGLPASGHWDNGKFFVVEGDEYAKSQTERVAKFLDLDPWISIITSLEWEHVDVYPDVAAMEETFSQLVKKTRGIVIACTDWPSVAKIVTSARKIVRYGVNPQADYQVTGFHLTQQGSAFTVVRKGKEFCRLSSPLMGKHNALNAVAAMIACLEAGVSLKEFTDALQSFQGVSRRQQTTVRDGVTWIDDYGHHPTEISRTLEAIRERYPTAKLWVVFQPHLASRTRALMAQFAHSFAPADRVLVVGLFASAREPGDPAATRDLVFAIARCHHAARSSGTLQDTAKYLSEYIEPGDVVVTMGAGDVYKVRELAVRQGTE